MDELADVFKKYAIPGEHPESLLSAIQGTRDKIHDLKLYGKTEEYIKELDKELRKWIRIFIVLFKKEELNTHNFVQIFSKLFSLLRIDKISIFNS
ncbi:MAG: hypothetical protein WCK88_00675 [bacterium]